MRMRSFALAAVAAWVFAVSATGAGAADVKVAVAANFTAAAKAIAESFTAATGHTATLSFGASGQFYTQIVNGAPFEVFLSADAERPRRLEAEGHTVPGSRFTYAVGRLALWSGDPAKVDANGAILRSGNFNKLAIADPKTAPYGEAAIETLTRLGLLDSVKGRIVQGTNIAQTHQFVVSGAADLGFVALAQIALDGAGSRWLVPEDLHSPIDQEAVRLKTGAANPAAAAFLDHLRGKDGLAIITRFGYGTR